MVYANDITNFNRPRHKLEEVLLFWMAVAGKEANQQANKLEALLREMWVDYGRIQRSGGLKQWLRFEPFMFILRAVADESLGRRLVAVRMGKYHLLERGFACVAERIDVKTCTLEELEEIPGIGPKTARCFLMHSRPDQRLAGLDTHILRWLRERAGEQGVPRSTPPAGATYRRLEQAFLGHADRLGLKPADLDLRIWRFYAGRDHTLDLTPEQAA